MGCFQYAAAPHMKHCCWRWCRPLMHYPPLRCKLEELTAPGSACISASLPYPGGPAVPCGLCPLWVHCRPLVSCPAIHTLPLCMPRCLQSAQPYFTIHVMRFVCPELTNFRDCIRSFVRGADPSTGEAGAHYAQAHRSRPSIQKYIWTPDASDVDSML